MPSWKWLLTSAKGWAHARRSVARRAAAGSLAQSIVGSGMDLDLDLTASFLVLAHEEHYGRAAARLHVTTPALTKRIQRLERQLGVVLIERGPAGVFGVTAAGLRFATAAGPLLAQAEAAVAAARLGPLQCTIRIGVPAGSGDFVQRIDVAGITRQTGFTFAEVRLARVEVPFHSLTTCLLENRVDILLTNAPVKHSAVDSFPLPFTSERIGVVDACHPLADAGAVDVGEFSTEPMGYNPAAPAEWMSPFWLGDVRPRKEARLVEVDAANHSSVLRRIAGQRTVTAIFDMSAVSLPPYVRALTLTGAAPVRFHVARRRTDRRTRRARTAPGAGGGCTAQPQHAA